MTPEKNLDFIKAFYNSLSWKEARIFLYKFSFSSRQIGMMRSTTYKIICSCNLVLNSMSRSIWSILFAMTVLSELFLNNVVNVFVPVCTSSKSLRKPCNLARRDFVKATCSWHCLTTSATLYKSKTSPLAQWYNSMYGLVIVEPSCSSSPTIF